ncbi:gamma-glutamyl AIG2-like cyclotransferase [Sinobacterium caligoides]|uniref:Putative gamma-glutamylcyclotransferase n=1 Tax=Sinobacterium caligoides TaxID=933926 RepID=A0A3N2DJX2_9GAMM|nr:gamma-glutamylcyclotransferase family protein [Sinobacterium caligoides]ROS00101.1 gamma-glutamyl AIG2-like cyclotransferase [Sinobacterium caligoides]
MNVFAYGLLKYPDMLTTLLGERIQLCQATLPDYSRRTIKEAEVPAVAVVIPKTGETVEGSLLLDVDERGIKVLDAFEMLEQGWYRRDTVQVQVADAEEVVEAQVYLAGPAITAYSNGDWDESAFIEKHYQAYIETIIPAFLDEINIS